MKCMQLGEAMCSPIQFFGRQIFKVGIRSFKSLRAADTGFPIQDGFGPADIGLPLLGVVLW
jgi:hypothetical protein